MQPLNAPHQTISRPPLETRKFRLLLAAFPVIAMAALSAAVLLGIPQSPSDIALQAVFALFPLAMGTVIERASKRADMAVEQGKPLMAAAAQSLSWTLLTDTAALLLYAGVAWALGQALLGGPIWPFIGGVLTQTAVYLVKTFRNAF